MIVVDPPASISDFAGVSDGSKFAIGSADSADLHPTPVRTMADKSTTLHTDWELEIELRIIVVSSFTVKGDMSCPF
jgi:hypothetical protein